MTKKNKELFIQVLMVVSLSLFLLYFIAWDTQIGAMLGRFASDQLVDFYWEHIDGKSYTISTVNWFALKQLLFALVCFFIILLGLLTYAISQYLLKKERREIAQLLANSMNEQVTTDVTLEFAEIEHELDKIKNNNQKSQEALKQEMKRTNDLVTYMAHDLRTPLASVIGYLNLLIDTEEISVETRNKYLSITLAKADRLGYLIDEFFDITRFNFQQIRLNYTDFNLKMLLEQMSEEFYPLLHSKQQILEINVDEELMLHGDSEELARVFNNILKNASAYGFESSKILIEAKRERQTIHLAFKNTGQTIPPEKIRMIFEKFYRLDTARSTNNGGAGLGLAISKEIIQAHNGEIGVNSDNNQTEFWVRIPFKNF